MKPFDSKEHDSQKTVRRVSAAFLLLAGLGLGGWLYSRIDPAPPAELPEIVASYLGATGPTNSLRMSRHDFELNSTNLPGFDLAKLTPRPAPIFGPVESLRQTLHNPWDTVSGSGSIQGFSFNIGCSFGTLSNVDGSDCLVSDVANQGAAQSSMSP